MPKENKPSPTEQIRQVSGAIESMRNHGLGVSSRKDEEKYAKYQQRFLQKNPDRSGRMTTLNVSDEAAGRLRLIHKWLGEDISMSQYLDNIIEGHFSEWMDVIKTHVQSMLDNEL